MHKAEILRAAPACAAAAFLSPKERVGIAMEKKKRVSFGMFLVTIGIVYGDIGTSPLYVMKSILKEHTEADSFLFLHGYPDSLLWG